MESRAVEESRSPKQSNCMLQEHELTSVSIESCWSAMKASIYIRDAEGTRMKVEFY